jgi:hypothetical protein
LVSALSHAPVPVEGKMYGVPSSLLKSLFRSRRRPNVSCGKKGSRWLTLCRIISRCTLSLMLTGPGTKRWCLPGGS